MKLTPEQKKVLLYKLENTIAKNCIKYTQLSKKKINRIEIKSEKVNNHNMYHVYVE
jgi:hypothetical protein